jgi:hypothetical protein
VTFFPKHGPKQVGSAASGGDVADPTLDYLCPRLHYRAIPGMSRCYLLDKRQSLGNLQRRFHRFVPYNIRRYVSSNVKEFVELAASRLLTLQGQ